VTAIVDSHVHLWDPTRFRMPWLDNNALLCRPYGLSDFETASAGLPVDELVYVQVDTTPAYGLLETRWAAAQPAPVAAIVAFAPIEDGRIVRTYLDELVSISSRVHGVRRLLQSEPDDFGIQPGFVSGLRELPGYGLSFDICVKHHQLASTIEMVRACPDTTFILDHIGKPDIRAQRLDPWRQQIAELASLPNVVGCKVSGLVTEADTQRWTVDQLRPYVAHVLAVFGADRVLFGGDWPVVTLAATYQRWVAALEELTAHLSADAKSKLWHANARRVYRL
jgi:predicted TIM-barrel fold metal-dependent hydrolase